MLRNYLINIKYDDINKRNNMSEIRVSCAGLASIKIGNKYLLVENRKSKSKGSLIYGPLGGALEFSPNGKFFLDSIGAKLERSTPDLRILIEEKHLKNYIKWFKTTNDREKSCTREVYEELVEEEKILTNLNLSDISEKYIKLYKNKRERFGVVSERLFEVFDIKFPKEIEDELVRISMDENSTIRLFTRSEILKDDIVSYHSKFIIQ